MRICIVHGNIDQRSGSGRYIADVAGRFAEDGHDVTVLCHECTAPLEKSGVNVIRIPLPRGSFGTWRWMHRLKIRAVGRFVRRELVGAREFDVLFGSDLLFFRAVQPQYPGAKFIYAPLSMIAPLEIRSYQLRGLRAWMSVRLYWKLQYWALGTCDRVLRFTPQAVEALEEYYGLSLAGKAVASVYVSRQFEHAFEGPIPLERPSPRELLWVGRLIRSKNVAFLVRAVALLRTGVPWTLVVVGNGPERENLEGLATELGVRDRVRFEGSVSDIAPFYARASLFLTGSLLEQYSLTLMEANACGVPCVALRANWKSVFNSVEHQIENGRTGYIVEQEEEMAARIEELLEDEDKRRVFARAGLERKKESFGFEQFFEELSALVAG